MIEENDDSYYEKFLNNLFILTDNYDYEKYKICIEEFISNIVQKEQTSKLIPLNQNMNSMINDPIYSSENKNLLENIVNQLNDIDKNPQTLPFKNRQTFENSFDSNFYNHPLKTAFSLKNFYLIQIITYLLN